MVTLFFSKVVTILVFEVVFGDMVGTVPGPHACRASLKQLTQLWRIGVKVAVLVL